MTVNTLLTPEHVYQWEKLFVQCEYIVADANFSIEAQKAVVELARKWHSKSKLHAVILDPTSVAKARRCSALLEAAWMVAPDRQELFSLLNISVSSPPTQSEILAACQSLLSTYSSLSYVLCKLDRDGVLFVSRSSADSFPAEAVSHIENVSGAGDSLVGVLASALATGHSLQAAVLAGMKAAAQSVQSVDTVPTSLQSLS